MSVDRGPWLEFARRQLADADRILALLDERAPRRFPHDQRLRERLEPMRAWLVETVAALEVGAEPPPLSPEACASS